MTKTGGFVSRAGVKLKYAIDTFKIDVTGKVCADFGSSTGGFVDCLLQYGAKKVYAVETGYGLLDWKLRNDPRVVVMEKTNALYLKLPEQVDLVTIDTGWTKQELILSAGKNVLKHSGRVVTLIKPSFELGKNQPQVKSGLGNAEPEISKLITSIEKQGFKIYAWAKSPILGAKGKNVEYVAYLANR